MKRILGTVVAIAGLLAFSSLASAAPVHFDTTGLGVSYSRVDDLNATGPCPTGMTLTCFIYSFAAGSSVDLDITGTAVTLTDATVHVIGFAPLLDGTLTFSTDSITHLTGATGTLVGSDIVWATPAASSVVGTVICTNTSFPVLAGSCALVGMIEGPAGVKPIQYLNVVGNTKAVNPVILGTWSLNSGTYPTAILGSTLAVTSISNVAQTNLRTSAITFGPTNLGATLPEPASATLVLLGLGALALRSRKA